MKPVAYAAYRRITLEDRRAKASLEQAMKMGCTFLPKTTLSDPVLNAEFEQVGRASCRARCFVHCFVL